MPLELLEIVPGQRFTQHLSHDQRLKMLSATSAPPKERFRTLQLCAENVHASVENGALVVCVVFNAQSLLWHVFAPIYTRPQVSVPPMWHTIETANPPMFWYYSDKSAKDFCLSVSPQMMEVEGRLLKAPALEYRYNNVITPSNGSWNLSDVQVGAR